MTKETDTSAEPTPELLCYPEYDSASEIVSASFHTVAYLAANPDVAAAHIDPLQHYLQYGITEGRHLA